MANKIASPVDPKQNERSQNARWGELSLMINRSQNPH